jgi:hypothetical protein
MKTTEGEIMLSIAFEINRRDELLAAQAKRKTIKNFRELLWTDRRIRILKELLKHSLKNKKS